MEIIPGILEKDWGQIERKIELVKSFAKTIHIDVIDGIFAQNTTFLDPTPFAKYSNNFFLEAHLMVSEPIDYLKPFAAAGFKRFLGHIERISDQAEFVAQAQLLGEVGLAIDESTGISSIKIPLDDLDCLLVMLVKAGASGQSYDPECLKKIEGLKGIRNDIPIEADGGINDQTILLAKNAGAARFVTNSFLFSSSDPQSQFNLLKKAFAFD